MASLLGLLGLLNLKFEYIEDGSSVSYSHFGKHRNQTILQQHKTDRPIALDIFAGGGGMSIGLSAPGGMSSTKLK